MNVKKTALGLMIASMVFSTTLPTAQAASLKQGMTQGEFALALVQEIGALPYLPPAANEDDAIRFLTKLGLVPCPNGQNSGQGCGWDAQAPADIDFLANLLGLTDEEKDAAKNNPNAFDELLDRVLDLVRSSFNNLNTGVSGAGAPVSGSGIA